MKAANPDGRNWFQLYVMRQREISYGLVERAAAAGFDTLMFTVDTPVAGARLRDKRNGFSIPPQLTLGTIVNAIPRPWWWWDFLTDADARVRVALEDRRHRRRAAGCGHGPVDQPRRPQGDPRDVAGQARDQGRAERRGLEEDGRLRGRRHPALEPRRPAARPGADPVPPAAGCGARGRQGHRGDGRHRHHERRGHRGVDRARRQVHARSAAPTSTA